jgi:hypothetical protein
MHLFDPKDWWGTEGRGVGHGHRPRRDPGLDRALLCGLAAAACLCIASFAPIELIPYVAAELLVLAALCSALEGVLRGETLAASRLTCWDQAAILMALALLLGLAFGMPDMAVVEAPAP